MPVVGHDPLYARGLGSAWAYGGLTSHGALHGVDQGAAFGQAGPRGRYAMAAAGGAASWAWGGTTGRGAALGQDSGQAVGAGQPRGLFDAAGVGYGYAWGWGEPPQPFVGRYVLRPLGAPADRLRPADDVYQLAPLGAPADRVRATATRARLRGQAVDRTRK